MPGFSSTPNVPILSLEGVIVDLELLAGCQERLATTNDYVEDPFIEKLSVFTVASKGDYRAAKASISAGVGGGSRLTASLSANHSGIGMLDNDNVFANRPNQSHRSFLDAHERRIQHESGVVWIGNLHPATSPMFLAFLFSAYGNVLHVNIRTNPRQVLNGWPVIPTHAYLTLNSSNAALQAEAMDRYIHNGLKMRVQRKIDMRQTSEPFDRVPFATRVDPDALMSDCYFVEPLRGDMVSQFGRWNLHPLRNQMW